MIDTPVKIKYDESKENTKLNELYQMLGFMGYLERARTILRTKENEEEKECQITKDC